jgi:hypothetical protein
MVARHRIRRTILDQPRDSKTYLAQFDNLIDGLNARRAGYLLYQLGQQYVVSGQTDLAIATFDRLAEDYPHHPLADVAQAWQVGYYASGEAAWLSTLRGQSMVASVAVAAGNTRQPEKSGAELRRATAQAWPGTVVPASGATPSPTDPAARSARAVEIGQILERREPLLFTDPALRFPLAVAQRRSGAPEVAEQLYAALQRSRPRDAWWRCAAAEHWLDEPTGRPPKPVWWCHRAATRPHLDGHLDEAFWQETQAVELKSPDHDDSRWPAVVRLASDNRYLYIAVECRKSHGVAYPTSAAPRPRDPDLANRDRVDLLFDIDRDYATYYRLTIDHRGWTGEACLEDVTWNPTWYVAADDDPETWTIEAAIAWRELQNQPPPPGSAWAVGVERIIPGVGFQAWTTPADVDRRMPQGFGLLRFK